MKCEMCNEGAFCHCIYGLYEYKTKPETPDGPIVIVPRNELLHEHELCKIHMNELWDKIRGSVNSGYMHFEIRKLSLDKITTV